MNVFLKGLAAALVIGTLGFASQVVRADEPVQNTASAFTQTSSSSGGSDENGNTYYSELNIQAGAFATGNGEQAPIALTLQGPGGLNVAASSSDALAVGTALNTALGGD